MFYSIFVLLCGIYVGQEYEELPRVKLLSLSIINYLANMNEQNNDPNLQNEEFTIMSFLKAKIQ